jgi:hypothetical protein
VGLKVINVQRSLAEAHYADLSSRPFFGALVDYIISGPVVSMVRTHLPLALCYWGMGIRTRHPVQAQVLSPEVLACTGCRCGRAVGWWPLAASSSAPPTLLPLSLAPSVATLPLRCEGGAAGAAELWLVLILDTRVKSSQGRSLFILSVMPVVPMEP